MCRADHAENEAETECDQTGVPCLPREIQLLASNRMAWDLYWQSRLPDRVSDVVLALRPLELSEFEANELSSKIEHLAGVVSELEAKKMREATEEARRNGGR